MFKVADIYNLTVGVILAILLVAIVRQSTDVIRGC